MNTGIENHTFLKETVFLNKNMDLYTHITPFLLKEIYGKLINIHNMLNPCFFSGLSIFFLIYAERLHPHVVTLHPKTRNMDIWRSSDAYFINESLVLL